MEEMAERCGVHRNSQAAYEKGRTPFNVAYLLIAQDMGLDIVYIITGRRLDGHLGAEEEMLLSGYAQLSARERVAVLSLISTLAFGNPISVLELDKAAAKRSIIGKPAA